MVSFSCLTWVIYRHFPITIVASMTLSVICRTDIDARTLSTLLKATTNQQRKGFRRFGLTVNFGSCYRQIFGGVSKIIKQPVRWNALVYGIIVGSLSGLMRVTNQFLTNRRSGPKSWLWCLY